MSLADSGFLGVLRLFRGLLGPFAVILTTFARTYFLFVVRRFFDTFQKSNFIISIYGFTDNRINSIFYRFLNQILKLLSNRIFIIRSLKLSDDREIKN